MEEIEYSTKFKFGDIVLNHYAGENNPHRKGIFIRYCRRQSSNAIELTDMKGEFWYLFRDKDSKNQIIGNILQPIELPSEEEIDEYFSLKIGETRAVNDSLVNRRIGAKWMLSQIKGK